MNIEIIDFLSNLKNLIDNKRYNEIAKQLSQLVPIGTPLYKSIRSYKFSVGTINSDPEFNIFKKDYVYKVSSGVKFNNFSKDFWFNIEQIDRTCLDCKLDEITFDISNDSILNDLTSFLNRNPVLIDEFRLLDNSSRHISVFSLGDFDECKKFTEDIFHSCIQQIIPSVERKLDVFQKILDQLKH